jgi:tRNA modification GTPase
MYTYINLFQLNVKSVYMYSQENINSKDTIFAECTGKGKSSVKIFRISGDKAREIALSFNPKISLNPRQVSYINLYYPNSNNLIDKAIVIFFKGPESFTGEDILEIQTHGSMAIVKIIYDILYKIKNVRIAEPGEFSKRAFLNGKMDLTEAEGLADLIDAETTMQHKQAVRQYSGELKNIYESWRKILIEIYSNLEALIDFPEEDIPEEILEELKEKIFILKNQIKNHLKDNNRGQTLKNGIKLVIIGEPNVGKSSLINYLSRNEVSIISDIAGTTRDMINSHLDIGGYPFVITDTAGINYNADNEIEKEGIKRAIKASHEADIKIILFDYQTIKDIKTEILSLVDERAICVLNKIDIQNPNITEIEGNQIVQISIKNSIGLDNLLDEIIKFGDKFASPSNPSITRIRYRENLEKIYEILDSSDINGDIVLLAEDIRISSRYIGRITGKISVEDILGEIFANFCIGK